MFGGLLNRARRLTAVQSLLNLRSIVKRDVAIIAGEAANKPRTQKYTATHNQAAIQSTATQVDILVDGVRKAGKVMKKMARTAGALQNARMVETEHGHAYEAVATWHRGFEKRFPRVAELLAKRREKIWKFVVPVLCAFGVSFVLDYSVMEFLAPEVAVAGLPLPIGWLLENFPLVGATCIAAAEAVMVAYAGKEAAWAWSPFQGDPQELRKSEAGEFPGIVFSDRGRVGHRIGFALLALTLLGLVVALVALREKALGLLSGLHGGGAAGGLAGSMAEASPDSGGFWRAVELLVIGVFPLLVAGWAAYLHESPLTGTLADLAKARQQAFERLKRATERRVSLETRLVELGEALGLVNSECDADQFLARLYPHMVAEVVAEASPEFYGVVSDDPHPLLWRIDETAAPGDVAKRLEELLAEQRAKVEPGTEGNGDNNHKVAV